MQCINLSRKELILSCYQQSLCYCHAIASQCNEKPTTLLNALFFLTTWNCLCKTYFAARRSQQWMGCLIIRVFTGYAGLAPVNGSTLDTSTTPYEHFSAYKNQNCSNLTDKNILYCQSIFLLFIIKIIILLSIFCLPESPQTRILISQKSAWLAQEVQTHSIFTHLFRSVNKTPSEVSLQKLPNGSYTQLHPILHEAFRLHRKTWRLVSFSGLHE